MKKACLAGILGLAVALLAAGPAQASTVTIAGGNEIKIAESGSENNQIGVSYSLLLDTYTVRDGVANLTPSGACVMVNANTATCPGAGITSIEVDTDARSDTITLDATIPTTVAGDLDGGGDDDMINGGRGKDDTKGGSGKDLIDGREGADDINGGSGSDTLLYSTRTTPLTITIGSGNDNDGNELDFSPGTLRDTVRGDVEMILAGTAADSITGDNSAETFNGGDGNDTLNGNGGRDSLLGFGGNDTLIGMGGNDSLLGFDGDDLLSGGDGDDTARGSLGNDRLFGGPHEDRLAGGAENDSIFGDTGVDVMKGKTGIDVIRARDGTRDVKINCGPGPNGQEFAKRDKQLDPKAKGC